MPTKHVHLATGSLAGRFNAVAECGRLVGRMSITTNGPDVTCPRCRKGVATTLRDSVERDALIDANLANVGELVRKGKPMFYAYIDGTYREHTDRRLLAERLTDSRERTGPASRN